MDNKHIFPRIRLRKLVLVGARKQYSVEFKSGLNIIYGDSDTGKSSILNLIDYSLGAKSVYLYSEIEETGRYSLLEVSLNGKVYTVKRDIFDSNKDIEVFSTSIENIGDVFPQKYYSNFSKSGELEYFSDFILTNLGVAPIKIKESPSKEESRMIRLSFRDVFKYCYLTQDEVGSKQILDSNDWVLKSKNQEVFKYIFNLLDSNISQLQAEISEASKQQDDLIRKHKTVASFLRDTQLDSYDTLTSSKEQIEDEIYELQREISNLNIDMISDSEAQDELRMRIGNLDAKLQSAIMQFEVNDIQIRNNVGLKKEYLLDIQKIDASLEVIEKIAGPTAHSYLCPLCSTSIQIDDIKTNLDQYEKVALDKELRNLRKRLKEIDSLISVIKEENEAIQNEIVAYKDVLKKLRGQLDIESKELVSPFLSQMEKLIGDKATLIESKKSIDYLIKMRRSLEDIDSQNIVIDNKIKSLREKLDLLKDSAPVASIILEKLADYLLDFLKSSKLRNPYGISMNAKTFLPIVRNKQYEELTSGGVRTLVSIGYVLSLLQYSMHYNTNHPKLVMIDTVGKYIGKTAPKFKDTDKASDIEEGIGQGDATKYTEMYRTFVAMNKSQKGFQLIVVDNELPVQLDAELQQHVIKRFDESGLNGLPKGLIDDIA
jgi:hypothetical protein